MTTKEKFPLKLFNAVQNKNNNSIISWDKDGTNILIKDKDKLVSLLKYNSYDAFHRQLNLYGFEKIASIKNNTYDKFYLENFNNTKTSDEINKIEKKNINNNLVEIKNNENIENKIDSYIKLIEQSKNNINDNLLSNVLSFLVERKKKREVMVQEIDKLKKFYDKISGNDKNMCAEIKEE